MDDDTPTVEGAEEETEETQETTETPQETPAEGIDTKSKEDTSSEETTDKGTKLDSNPESRANQLRANAEAKIREYEKFLNDPNAIENYLKQLRGDQSKGEEISIDKIQTTEDLQKFLKQEREKDQKELEDVKTELFRTKSLNEYDADMTYIKRQYPDLSEKQENAIADIFEKVNVKNGVYTPALRLRDIADSVMSVAEDSKKQGSKEAQTIVRNAKSGRNISGTVSAPEVDTSKMSASQLIAYRMKEATRKRS